MLKILFEKPGNIYKHLFPLEIRKSSSDGKRERNFSRG